MAASAKGTVRITYDPETDALAIMLREDVRAEGSIHLESGVTVHLDRDGHIVGIKVLDARGHLGGDPFDHLVIERFSVSTAAGTEPMGDDHSGATSEGPGAGRSRQTSDGSPAGSLAQGAWDERSFLQDLQRRTGPDGAAVAEGILGWARDWGLLVAWQQDGADGALVPSFEHDDVWYAPFTVRTDGTIRLNLGELRSIPGLSAALLREEVIARLRSISGIRFDAGAVEEDLRLSLSQLVEPDDLARFLGSIDWAIERIRAT